MAGVRRLRVVILSTLGVLLPTALWACLWDYDTIKMERSRFPETLELITGKFLRHSPEFYEWRIKDRLARLKSDPADARLLDDLSVAYDKTGQLEQAIETALREQKLHPDRYEVASNLGTFYFHAGRLDDSLTEINRALQINADAHFGREKYQKILTEYVLPRWADHAPQLPLARAVVRAKPENDGAAGGEARRGSSFADFVVADIASLDSKRREVQSAIRGVLGMMRFAKHDSPILLEALGSLLEHGGDRDPETDAKLLAARAYLQASYHAPDETSKTAYREMARGALSLQTPRRDKQAQVTLEAVEEQFQQELTEAQEWYTELHGREVAWIRSGKQPEAEFDKLYDAAPEVAGMDVQDALYTAAERRNFNLLAAGIAFLCVFLVGGFFVIRTFLRRVRAA